MNLLSFLIETETMQMQSHRKKERINPSFLPIRIGGGIGDVICSVPILRRLVKSYQCLIYTGHVETLKYFAPEILTQPMPMPDFTWHLEVSSICRFWKTEEFKGFLDRDHESLFHSHQSLLARHHELDYLVLKHPHKDFLLTRYAEKEGFSRRTLPCYTLDGYILPEPQIERRHAPLKYITIHDGYDNQSFDIGGIRSTKQWDIEKFNQLVQLIKKEYPDTPILQLGSKTSRPIEGIERCLINQTSILEAFDILSESTLHIDGDSGLVHAASFMGVPCVVLYGPTTPSFYGYAKNKNLKSYVCEGGCYWLQDDWMKKCPIGYPNPICMDSIPVQVVFDAVKEQMKRATSRSIESMALL